MVNDPSPGLEHAKDPTFPRQFHPQPMLHLMGTDMERRRCVEPGDKGDGEQMLRGPPAKTDHTEHDLDATDKESENKAEWDVAAVVLVARC